MFQDNHPLVSIIIPVYGVERYIKKCIDSVLHQTYDHLEVVIINDCTKDRSMEIVHELMDGILSFNGKIQYLEHHENRGLSAARQTGIEACKGDYLFHLDSDDYLEPDAIRVLVETLVQEDHDIVIGATVHEYIDGTWNDFRAIRVKETFSKEAYLKEIIRQDTPNTIWGKLIRTSLYKNNKIRCVESICYAEDYAVLPKLMYYAQSIGFVALPIYHYTHYNECSYTNNYKWKNIKDCFEAEKVIEEFFYAEKDFLKSLEIAHAKRSAWAIRQQLANSHELSEIQSFIEPVKFFLSEKKYYSFNHYTILLLYKLELMFLLKLFIEVSGKIVKKRKI